MTPDHMPKDQRAHRLLAKIQSPCTFLILGAVLRLIPVLSTCLTPEENRYAVSFSQPLGEMLAGIRGDAELPLYPLLMHIWSALVHSDIMLRMPSTIAGLLALWLFYRWLVIVTDELTARVGLLLLAGAPTLIVLTSRISSVSCLLLFASAALYWLELALRDNSARRMLLALIAMALTALSHSAALWLIILFAGYAGVRLFTARDARHRLLGTWLIGQGAVLILALVVCLPAINLLRLSVGDELLGNPALIPAYYTAAHGNPILFMGQQLAAAFRYFFSSGTDAFFMLAFFLAGVILRWSKTRAAQKTDDFLAYFLVLPFVLAALLAMFGAYPLGAVTQSIYLMPFAIAGAVILITWVLKGAPQLSLLAGLLLVLVWNIAVTPPALMILPGSHRRSFIDYVVNYIQGVASPRQPIFCDFETFGLLRRYIDNNRTRPMKHPTADFSAVETPDYRLIGSLTYASFGALDFGDDFAAMTQAYNLMPGETVWVAGFAGSGDLARSLATEFGISYPGTIEVGNNIVVMPIPVGKEPSSAYFAAQAETLRLNLITLANSACKMSRIKFRVIFFPSNFFQETMRQTAGVKAMPYAEFYARLNEGRASLDNYLPALALWHFGTREPHIEGLAHMNDRENYVASSYRFTLIAFSPDSLTAAYAIESMPESSD